MTPSIRTESRPLLEARDIAVAFSTEGGRVDAVRGVGFHIDQGETLALVGESGSGKSVTARALMGLLSRNAQLAPQARILLDGRDVPVRDERRMRAVRGQKIAMVFQEPMTSLNPMHRIGSQIVEAIQAHTRTPRRAALTRACELLAEVRLPDPEALLWRYPHELSGGQRQRVMIAMALSNRPALLIADEPTTALDVRVQADILELIKDLQARYALAVLLITHDLTVVRSYADRIAVMRQGLIVETGPTATVLDAPDHPYTRQLRDAEPSGYAGEINVEDQPPLLEARGVRIVYGARRKAQPFVAVQDAEVTVRRGEAVGIVGESGSGKTSLALALTRLAPITGGSIAFDGAEIDALSRRQMRPLRTRLQIVLQDPFSSLNPRLSVQALIEEGLIVNRIGQTASERLVRVRQALSEAGMPQDILHRFPHEFSGGQRQRLSIARAIAVEPELLVLDEPTSALDVSVQAKILETLKDLQKRRGLGYLFISHDLRVVRALCQRIIVMRDGAIVESGPTRQVLETPQSDYTAQLVKAAFEVRRA